MLTNAFALQEGIDIKKLIQSFFHHQNQVQFLLFKLLEEH